jgi:hypothetical protein
LKQIIPRNEFVVSAVAPVRAADTVYDARLIPLLLHEDFSAYPVATVALGPAGTIGDWTEVDQDPTSVAVGSPPRGRAADLATDDVLSQNHHSR